MDTDQTSERPRTQFTSMTNRQLGGVMVLGAIAGALTWALGILLENYIYHPVFCGTDGSRCGEVARYADMTAIVLVGIVVLFGLVRLRIYRPLVAVLTVSFALWGLSGHVLALPGYGTALLMAAFYAVAYALFVWLLRLRMFWLALGLTVVLAVAVRWALIS